MHNYMRVVLLLCLFAAVKLSPAVGSRGSERDAASLMEFKNAVTQDPFAVLNTWNRTLHFCNWTGVLCNTEKWRVVRLDLKNKSLEGVLPPKVGNLSFLHYLDLSFNRLWGQIPSALGRLRRLKSLFLNENLLEGSLPHSLGDLLNLQVLSSWANRHTGSIPLALGNCSMLRVIDLSDNNLQGTIPSQIGSLTKLELLNLDNNRVSGEIPTSVLNCTQLRNLSFYNNSLTGTIPAEIGVKISKLEYLVLPKNKLSGLIPKSLGNCSRLSWLELAWNELSGIIPDELGNLFRLTNLNLFDNHFMTGGRSANGIRILNALTNCSLLKRLDLTDNHLEGTLPPSLGLLSPLLSTFSVESNNIRGHIPQQIGNLTGLTELYLGGNSLDGAIPSAFAKLPNLVMLNLSRNQLEGSIPLELGRMRSLEFIFLYNNCLSGTIPKSLGSLENLRKLDLSSNKLNGSIPPQLGDCRNLELLDVSYNLLTGSIPLEVANLHNFQFFFILSNNQLTGPVSGLLGGMQMVQAIDLSCNKLSGSIPNALSTCAGLEYLNLSHNELHGTLPASFENQLKSLRDIDLSFNNLSGLLPPYLDTLEMLQHINLSYNHFLGPVPCSGAYMQPNITSFLGNPQLCGKCLGLQDCPQGTHHGDALSGNIVLGASIGTVFALCCIVGGFYLFHRRIKRAQFIKSLLGQGFMRISSQELHRATQGFSAANLLGKGSFGSVYKGHLSGNMLVAIKLFGQDPQNSFKHFVRECRVLRQIRHRNLVKVLTSSSAGDLRALVLEYMSQGSLEQHLHKGETGICSLSLKKRVNIALDVAHGMSYLHHDCSPPVVHCDLKPSNVLMDETMTGHVADFGISRLLTSPVSATASSSTSRLKGTAGYLAPEYGVGGRVSSKGDVYSFGILILEMVTKRRPTDDMFCGDNTLPGWVRRAFPEAVEGVVDRDLLIDQQTVGESSSNATTNIITGEELESSDHGSCLLSFIGLGLQCARENPANRPTMREVEGMLEKMVYGRKYGNLREHSSVQNLLIAVNEADHPDVSTDESETS